MNTINSNRDTQTNIQTPTPGWNYNVKANQGGNETNQGNGDNRRHIRGQNQKNRGENQQSIQHQISNFTGADDIFNLFMLPTFPFSQLAT